MLNTIQINKDEEKLILKLKKDLGLPTKKAVVIQALELLLQEQKARERKERIKAAVALCREESLRINEEMSPHGYAVTHDELFED